MAKIRSKKSAKPSVQEETRLRQRTSRWIKDNRAKWREFRKDKHQPHKSFRRSYREDYIRKTKATGLLSHAMLTFQMIFKNWKIFLPLIAIMVLMYIVLVGLMSEDFYRQFQDSIEATNEELAHGEIGNFAKAGLLLVSTITTGGLNTGMNEVQVVFTVLLFLIIWLTTIYLLRHLMAGGKPRMRDGLYNALGPLVATLLVFVVMFIQALPLMLVIITYSAAVTTGFLNTPFYALVYFIFAALMILMTVYLWSSSLIALTAVTAPGIYPMKALFVASDLMSGRRIKFTIRIFYLLLVAVIIYIIAVTPIILIDLWIKSVWDLVYGIPIVPFFMLVVTCFIFVYVTTYVYCYYRYLIDYQED